MFAHELEALRRGELAIEALWERHADRFPDFEDVLASVQHWVADGDIRARDEDYRLMQESAFDQLLSHLRAGRVDEAKDISFLSENVQT
jgi:hypothetical protein